MAASDDPRTLGRTRLSFADAAEIDDFVKTLAAFERGELTPDQWRVYRLRRGTDRQRPGHPPPLGGGQNPPGGPAPQQPGAPPPAGAAHPPPCAPRPP